MDEYRARGLKINTYTLVGGDVNSFFTEKERVKTIAKYIDQAKAGGYSGVDLDFEHLPYQLICYSNLFNIFAISFRRVA